MSDYVKSEISDGIATVTFNRPQSYNAFNLPTAKALSDILLALSPDDSIRGIIMTGAGSAFSAGGDLKRVAGHAQGPAVAFHELAAYVHLCVVEIRRMPKPVIAAINGVAAGGGFSLALACDFRVMAESARLKQGFTSSGLCIDGGGTFALPRLVGLARALEIAAFDDMISAEQALAWGLVTRVAPDDQLMADSMVMARRLAQRSLHSFGWSKRLLTDSFETSFEAQLENERQGLISCVSHPDGQEGLQAFLEKRSPRFNEIG